MVEFTTSRFFVAFMAPAEVDAYARRVILELGDRHHTRTANAPPHITLQPPFEWAIAHQPALEASLSQFAHHQCPVRLVLDGFGAFAPHVLFINVVKTPKLMKLQTALQQHLETSLGILDPQTQRRGFSPHMTVASRRLTPTIFRNAWAELQPRPVHFEYEGDRLTLLLYQGSHWTIHGEFLLLGTPSPLSPLPKTPKSE